MAAVLGYGFEPTQSAAMHSFFHQVNGEQKSVQSHQNGTSACNLDGPHNSSEENPFAQSKISRGNPTPQLSTDNGQSESQASNLQRSKNNVMAAAPEADVDLNSDRRKRRRTTPQGTSATVIDFCRSASNSQIGSAASILQLTAPVQEQDGYASGMLGTDIATKEKQEIDAKIHPEVPRRRTPRKSHLHRDEKSDNDFDQQSIENSGAQSSPSKKKISTPKKIVSLHANGKLLSSPVAGPVPASIGEFKSFKQKSSTLAGHYKMKNGKFTQSLEVVIRYGKDEESRKTFGKEIDSVLLRPSHLVQTYNKSSGSKTHPFFLGKVKPKLQASDRSSAQSDNTDNDNEATIRRQEPVAWKDIKFSTRKPALFKSSESLQPPWPPLIWHHIGNENPQWNQIAASRQDDNRMKLKSRTVQLRDDEDVLCQYAMKLNVDRRAISTIGTPRKKYLTGTTVAQSLASASQHSPSHQVFSSLRSAIVSGLSPFDRGECAGPNMWSLQYAPERASQVLQPSALVLYQWLQSLAVHNVKSGTDPKGNIKKLKGTNKKKRRKNKDEFDDFIVNSDEDEETTRGTKTAILITGPTGSGKTASVYAVAKELGFEVFEIHPGMRRSAKDIFDKVGDMAHNHLVQKGSGLCRDSSVAPSDTDTLIDTIPESNQTSVAGFLGVPTAIRPKNIDCAVSMKSRREQKQSLILFEEVDLLFEDDKGFWSGVQSLIQHSKRPVVMTCNDIGSIPIDDLDLYDILTYSPVQKELATDCMQHIAAAEGHILDAGALSTLYESKGYDLRACITELSFWCQMTVGSKQGGLDWMGLTDKTRNDHEGRRLRIFSEGTFQRCLDLVPEIADDNEIAMKFAQNMLGISVSEWCDFAPLQDSATFITKDTNLQSLSRITDIAEARSVLDLFDDFAAPPLAVATAALCRSESSMLSRDTIASAYMQQLAEASTSRMDLVSALGPVMVEKPTFPPAQGRLAPSIDTGSSSVATEVAPYVRCIVNFDQRSEQQRHEIFGSQGKTRNTRAARAAAEGGDKASTRTERWFPRELDFDMVLRTAGNWPESYIELEGLSREASTD